MSGLIDPVARDNAAEVARGVGRSLDRLTRIWSGRNNLNRSNGSDRPPAMPNERRQEHRAATEGLERIRRAKTRHGRYSEEHRRLLQYIRALDAAARGTAKELQRVAGRMPPDGGGLAFPGRIIERSMRLGGRG